MMPNSTQTPYVGPRPFTRQDQNRFFGRDREASELLSLIVANPIVVLYAQSGAGKTSLLDARVSPSLEAEGFEVWPFARVQGPAIENINPADINNIYSFYTLISWSGEKANPAELSQQSIRQYLAERPHTVDEFDFEQPRVLIFDQFEELFTAFPARWQEREAFFNELNRALEDDPLLRVVFSLREDYIAQLDPYAHLMPRNLRTRFRLERMRSGAALEAIRDPLLTTARQFSPGVAEQLVEDLRAVRVESMTGQITTVTGEFIEPVQLQVVCQNLWEDLPEEVTEITAVHLQTFGNVNQALSSFYERAISRALPESGVKEDELRRWFEEALITPAGTRGTVYRGAAATGGLANTAVDILENMHIIRGEFRAGSRWYELTHDRLIVPIQQSNRHWHDRRQQARIKRIRRLAISVISIVLLFGLCGYMLLFASAGGSNDTAIAATAVAVEEEAAADRGTAIAVQETATIAYGAATAQTTAVIATATAQHFANETATAEREAIETVAAQTAVAQQATETAVVQAVQGATATAAIVNPTSTAAAVQATRTAEELDRVRQPVRPLQPGISIGSQNSVSAGTLSAFVVDEQGVFYLLGPRLVLGDATIPVLQPSPIDGGKAENAVAVSVNEPLTGFEVLDATSFIGLARLEPGITFQTTVPDIGPIKGVRVPELGQEVWVYGRTSGLSLRQINCVDGCSLSVTDNVELNADFSLDAPLSSGDEGALVIDREGYALGIIGFNGENRALGISMTAVLAQFNVELVTVGQQIAEYNPGSPGSYRPVAFDAFSEILVSTDFQNIHLIDYDQPNTPPQLLRGHSAWIRSLVFSPNVGILASADDAGEIRLWNLNSSRILDPSQSFTRLSANDSTIWSIAFSPDGTLLAAVGLDRTVRLWDVYAPELESSVVATLRDNIYAVTFSPDGQWLLVGDGRGNIRIWNMDDLDADPLVLSEHEGTVFSLGFSPDGTLLASGDSAGETLLWDFTDLTKQPIVLSEAEDGFSVAFSPDGIWLATGGLNGTINLYELNNLEAEPLQLSGQSALINSLAFAPNGRVLASTSLDGTVRLWLIR